jgi:chitinase
MKRFISTEYIRQLVSLKSKNPNLKILAAIGGYNEGLVASWSNLAGSSAARNNFANNILSFLQNNNLNGIGEFVVC